MPEAAIRVEDLSKRFGDAVAVEDVGFEIGRGEIVALLGGNGAGKTTTLSILLGLLTPDSGRVEVLGVDMRGNRYEALPRMNFTSPYVDLPKRLTARENLQVYARLYGVPRPARRVAEVAEEFGIDAILGRPFGQLSSGQKTRVSLAKSFLNQPELLLLDEPTASLDPDVADWVRGYLGAYNGARGATVLLASHNMPEVERLCGGVLMMKSGRVVDRGSPSGLVAKYGRGTLEEVFLDVERGGR